MNNQISLDQLLGFLNEQTAEGFKTNAVDAFLRTNRVPHKEWEPFVHYDEATYARNLVYRNDLFELIVLAWRPQQRTPIHTHAGQRCWMLLSCGTLTFKNFEWNGKELKQLNAASTLGEGEVDYIDDTIGVHCIANATEQPAVSIHLYASPINVCQIYDEGDRNFRDKPLSYFWRADEAGTLSGLGQRSTGAP